MRNRRLITACVLACASSWVAASAAELQRLALKSGSIIEGVVLSQDADSITVETADGTIRNIARDDLAEATTDPQATGNVPTSEHVEYHPDTGVTFRVIRVKSDEAARQETLDNPVLGFEAAVNSPDDNPGTTFLTPEDMQALRDERQDALNRPTPLGEETDRTHR